MDVVMVHRNLTTNYLVGKGNEFRSVAWTECDACGTRVRPGGTRWPWSSGLRWPNLVLASAADNGEAARKGFGIPKKGVKPAVKKGGSSKGDQQQKGVLLNNAARTADREGSAQLSKKVSRLRVDPDEAKKGKVDFVRVQTWGEDEESGKLENLRVKSFSPAVTSSAETSAPFYEKLVNRLQLLESKGEIAVAQVKPLPSFDRWVFGEKRNGLTEAEMNLREEVFRARTVAVFWDLDNKPPNSVPPYDAALRLKKLGSEFGEVVDMVAYANKNAFTHVPARVREERQDRKLLDQLERRGLVKVEQPYVCSMCGRKCKTNYALKKHFKQLHERERQKREGKEPLQLFIQTVNSAGLCVSCDDDHEQVMEELPKAMQRTSVLLSVLAVEEQALVVSE
ncbi:hypothetical protein R1flu_017055 [Riccia fluitans]|uniref:C2H2-type domain-containing protein n=1 Tax=Riccia fluitans TaxID=41844 RepID=A0ABD1YPL2_9MARC